MKLIADAKTAARQWIIRALHRRGAVIQRIGLHGYDMDKYFDNLYKILFPSEALNNKRFYNIGAGRFRHHYWTNIDLQTGSLSEGWTREDIDFDIGRNQALPIADGIAEAIYTSHTIEHVRDESVINLFSESYRVLRKGGALRIVCPDIDLAVSAYRRSDSFFFEQVYGEVVPSLEHGLVRFFATELIDLQSKHAINDSEVHLLLHSNGEQCWMDTLLNLCSEEIQRIHPDNHINWFNEDKLLTMLRRVGFNNVFISRYGQSTIPVLRDIRYFDSTLPFMSLYIEAVK